MPNITIALTFDDGPHNMPPNENRTRMVLEALSPAVPGRPIKAAFFVQTHAPNRLPSAHGRDMAIRIHSEGHILAIHTGSHQDHVCHKRRVLAPADLPNTANGLHSDMVRAKSALREITGDDPTFVRATYGITNAACMGVYETTSLQHLHWDIDSGDTQGLTEAQIRERLRTETARRVNAGNRRLVYLFHDLKAVTSSHIGAFIETIRQAVLDAGHTPVFCDTTYDLRTVLNAKVGPGVDDPCPTNLP